MRAKQYGKLKLSWTGSEESPMKKDNGRFIKRRW